MDNKISKVMLDTQKHKFKVRLGKQGLHLFDRKTGTNILLDEVKFPNNQWTDCPRQVSIALTNDCNLFCSHCYASKVSSSLNKEEVQSWLLELDRAGCFGIGFGGGEPTLHPDFVELCQFGHDETNLAISFTTHGHHLTQKFIDQIKDSVNFTRVSIDGTWDRYEKIRGKSFQALLNKLNDLGKKLNYGVNYVVNETTISDLDELAKIAQDLGATELLLLPEEPVRKGTKISNQTLAKLIDWTNNYSGKLRLATSSKYKSEFAILEPLELETDERAFAHIDAQGIVKKTSFCNSGEIISETGVLEAIRRLYNK